MAEAIPSKRTTHGTEKVREHLLTSLHLGRLKPGDRVLSVRRLAGLTGMNRKTVHRAYQILEEEGFLVVRPGAGTYVAIDPSVRRTPAELVRSMNRCRGEAHALGLSPSAYADFVHASLDGGLAGLPLAVVECNLEQIEMIARDLRGGLGVAPRAVLLSDLLANPTTALSGVWSVVTTDCHRAEVEAAVRTFGMSVHRVALDADFPQTILRWARTRGVVIAVRDERFGGVFTRFLGQLGANAETLAKIRVVPLARIGTALREVGENAIVLLSPLVEREAETRIPAGARRASAHWRMAEGTLEGLRAELAFDLATRRQGSA
jgi:DNA-binding transcriptional regulator YhcF (GntR family)